MTNRCVPVSQLLRKGNAGVQIPTRIPEKIVVALFSGIVVNSGILVEAGRPHTSKFKLLTRLKRQTRSFGGFTY